MTDINENNLEQIMTEDEMMVNAQRDKEILRLTDSTEFLEDIVQKDLQEVLMDPFKEAFMRSGMGEDASEKNVVQDLAQTMRIVFEKLIPIAWIASQDMNYIYCPTEKSYITINPSILSKMLLTIATEAHAALRNEIDQRPLMPSAKSLTSAFAAKIGPTGNTTARVDQSEIMIFKNCFIHLLGKEGQRTSNAPIDKTVFHTHSLNVEAVAVDEPPKIWLQYCEMAGFGEPEMRAALEDLSLYIVSPSIARHESLFLLGSGRNGKSVLLNFYRKIIGSRFVGAASLEQIQKNFGLEPLLNKRLSLSSESGTNDFVDSKTFKAIVSGDPIQVDRKNVTAVTVVLPLKLAFALNEDPTIIDTSDGMFARVRVIRFMVEIPADKQIERFEDHLFKHGSEIVSWWIISHFQRHGCFNPKFNLPPIFDEWRKEIFVTGTDPVEAFIAKCITDAPGQRVSFQDVLQEYKRFVNFTGWSGGKSLSMSSRVFGKKFNGVYRRMHDRALTVQKSNNISYYHDVKLIPAKFGS